MKSIDTIYIKSQFVTPHGTERFTLVDPVTEQEAAHLILADKVDADNAIAAATSAYHELAGSSRDYEFERQVASARVRMESLGVVGLITPWNANYGMICSKLAMALPLSWAANRPRCCSTMRILTRPCR